MRVTRIAMLALLVGIIAGVAHSQTEAYGGPPDTQGQYDPFWRQRDAPYEHQPDYGYDHEQAPDFAVGFFYNQLSPYGEWVRHPHYGWAWFPRHVHAGWRPCSLGRWVGTDYGWTWVSDEPFGWAPLPPAVGFEIASGLRLDDFSLSLAIAPRERQYLRENKDLKASQDKDRRVLDQIHRHEMAQPPAEPGKPKPEKKDEGQRQRLPRSF